MSTVNSESSAMDESEMTAAVAAVVEVFSEASMESLVERPVEPPSLMSTMSVLPVGAVLTEARTAVSVKAYGARKVTLAVPVVRSVVSSEQATMSSQGIGSAGCGMLLPIMRVISKLIFRWAVEI